MQQVPRGVAIIYNDIFLNQTYFFYFPYLNRRPKNPTRDEIESSIPQTMQLFNRMNKKSNPSNVVPSSVTCNVGGGQRVSGNRYIMQQPSSQQQNVGSDSTFQNTKVRGYIFCIEFDIEIFFNDLSRLYLLV